MITHIHTEVDLADVLVNNTKVIIDFNTTWCGPCKAIKPQFERLSNDPKFSGIVFISIDGDKLPDVAMSYNVQAFPTFVFLKNAKVRSTIVGGNLVKLTQCIEGLAKLD